MIKKFTFTSIGLILLVGSLIGTKVLQFRAMGAAGAAMVMPPETVTAAPVRAETWGRNITATGSFVAVQGVTVSAEIGGKVMKIMFEAGANAKAGDLLVQLDTAAEEAQFRAAEASAQLAKINLSRARELMEKNTISRSELDLSEAQFKQATAQAQSLRAVIEKKTIRAPFAGRVGIRLINLGQILKEGDAIASLQTLDPIYVNFSVPQQRLSNLVSGAPVQVMTDAAPGQTFAGKINVVSPEIDPATRNVRVQATVANDGEKLRPGMFANVEVELPAEDKVLVIPATSVLYAPYGDSVFVIDEKKGQDGKMQKVLRQQFIRLGVTRGDFVTVVSGLKPGEEVITSGVFKLRPGMAVIVDNQLAPDAKLSPKPANT